ncbi:ParD-like family protein [Tomitella cavernea]|nr:ParD-like family protein [Tomitella cavernea]
MTTMPTRIDEVLFAAAKDAGRIRSRSAAQQIIHWARLGRALESSAALSTGAIEQVLAGEKSYEDLDAGSQKVVRGLWHDRIDDSIASLNLSDEFTAAGESRSEADSVGAVGTHDPAAGE